jgi:hypothetical protein
MKNLSHYALVGTIQSELGRAPASGAADDALVVGFRMRACEQFRPFAARRVRREGAPNSSRGGGAPHSFQRHLSGLEQRAFRTSDFEILSDFGFRISVF